MTPSQSFRPSRWFLAGCVCAVVLAPSARASNRVAILDMESEEIEAAAVPGLIEGLLARHDDYQVASREEVWRALSLWRHPTGCVEDSSCVATIAGETHADVVIGGALKRNGQRYALTLIMLDPRAPGNMITATETMKHLSNIELNVKLCLKRMMRSNGASSPPAADAVKPAPAQDEGAPAKEQRTSRSPDDSWLHRRNNLT